MTFQANAFQPSAFQVDGLTGTLAAAETGADTFAGTGGAVVSGTLAAAETGSDTFTGSGEALVTGALAAQEVGQDVASFTGRGRRRRQRLTLTPGHYSAQRTGVLHAQETGSDRASFTSSELPDLWGWMDAKESGSDTASFAGAVSWDQDDEEVLIAAFAFFSRRPAGAFNVVKG
jgi:hypothetical protein